MEVRILSFLLKREKINFWELCPILGNVPALVRVLKKMRRQRKIAINKSEISLTEKGKEFAALLKIKAQDLPPEYEMKIDKSFLKKFEGLRKKIKVKLEFDQYQITSKGIARKVEFMKRKGDIFQKKIVCIGDDDFMGIALALTGLPKEIAIIDIDKSILDYETRILKELNYRPVILEHNLLEPIPEKLKNRYDVFITEPPDTVEGNTLFFSRGVECIKKKGGIGYIGISPQDFAREKYLTVQKNILKMNSLIIDILTRFEPYETLGDEFKWVFGLPKEISLPKTSWFYSDLIRTEILSGAKPLIKRRPGPEFVKRFINTDIHC